MTRPQVVDGWRIDITARTGVARVLTRRTCALIVAAALRAAGAPNHASVTVILMDDDEISGLNEAHLGHEGPTDVLSFPLLPPVAFPPHEGQTAHPTPADPAPVELGSRPVSFVLPPRARPHLGDIAVSVERAIAQAREGRGGQTGDLTWEPRDELRLLLTHGVLHLCGWDHAEPSEERAMRALEGRLLRDPLT
ncbi:MAG: rRNA maturation RNase YbeY [Chloroflexota bacterium]